MARVNLTIIGQREAIAILENFQESKVEAVKEIVNDTAVKIVADAKARAGVDTGQLRASIHMRAYSGGLTIDVGSNLAHAVYQEYGTGIFAENGAGRKTPWVYYYQGNKGPRGFRWTRGNKPHPFLMPAFNSEKDNYVNRLKKELGV